MDDLDAGIGLRGYGRVLSHGPALRPFLAAVVGRLPIAMTGLGMVVLIQQVRGNYSMAGLVTGVFALATAVGAAVWGRLMDVHGQPRVLVPTALVSGAAIAALSLAVVSDAPGPLLVGLAILAGVFFPPVSPAMRAAWRVIFSHQSSRRLGYALDASAVELIFVMGPLLLSGLALVLPPQGPLLVSAGLLVAGTVLYSMTWAARTAHRHGTLVAAAVAGVPTPETVELQSSAEATRGTRSRTSLGQRTALAAPGVAAVLAVSLFMALGFGQLDTSIVATAEAVLGDATKLGLLFLFIAGGSAIGGITYGARTWPGDETWHLVGLLAGFTLSLVPWPFLLRLDEPPLPILFLLLFLTGLTIAPCLIIFQGLLDKLSPPHRMTEAQALLSASQTTGAAGGMAVAGITIDAWAAPGGLAGAVVAIGTGALVAAVVRGRWADAA